MYPIRQLIGQKQLELAYKPSNDLKILKRFIFVCDKANFTKHINYS